MLNSGTCIRIAYSQGIRQQLKCKLAIRETSVVNFWEYELSTNTSALCENRVSPLAPSAGVGAVRSLQSIITVAERGERYLCVDSVLMKH